MAEIEKAAEKSEPEKEKKAKKARRAGSLMVPGDVKRFLALAVYSHVLPSLQAQASEEIEKAFSV